MRPAALAAPQVGPMPSLTKHKRDLPISAKPPVLPCCQCCCAPPPPAAGGSRPFPAPAAHSCAGSTSRLCGRRRDCEQARRRSLAAPPALRLTHRRLTAGIGARKLRREPAAVSAPARMSTGPAQGLDTGEPRGDAGSSGLMKRDPREPSSSSSPHRTYSSLVLGKSRGLPVIVNTACWQGLGAGGEKGREELGNTDRKG